MTEIYIEGQRVDLYGNEQIVASFAVNSLTDIDSRQGVYSNTFRIPRTTNNISIFESSHIVISGSKMPYKKAHCRVVADGVEFYGLAELKSFKEDFEVFFVSGNADFFLAIKDRKLSDLDLREYDHTWNRATVIASQSNTEGYIYPVADYNADSPNFYIDNDNARVDTRTLCINYFLHTLFNKIFNESGFDYDDSVFSDVPEYYDYVLPLLDYKYSIEEENNRLLRYGKSTQSVTAAEQRILFTDAQYPDPYGLFDPASSEFKPRGASFTGTIFANLEFATHTWGTVRVYKDGQVVKTMVFSAHDLYVFDYVFEHREGEEFTYYYTLQLSASNTLIDSVFETQNIALNKKFDRKFFVDSSAVPDMLQSDLIKMVFFLFNIIPITEGKTVQLIRFSDMVGSKTQAKDWSNKIDESEQVEIKYHSNYSQNNIFKYKEDESVDTSSLGNGNIIIDDDTLEQEKTLIELPVAYSDVVVRCNAHEMAWVKSKEAGATKNKVEYRLLKLRSANVMIRFFESNPSLGTDHTGVSFAMPPDSFETILQRHYSEFTALLNDYKEITLLIKLSHADVNQLDFTKPVYIERFSSYFYLSEVIQHDFTSNDSTLVKLIQLK
jgi:hypothetical protein